MKRTWRAILALTLVCAVALTAAAMALGSQALPLTMTDACTIGDPAAAEGLHMAARIGMEQNRLQWRMDYDPAADTTDASFRLAYSDRSGQWIFDGYGYNIQCLLVDQEDDSDPICREVLRQARASGEELVDVTVHLADYWQDLPLSLSGAPWSGGEDFCDVYGPWDIGDTVPFPALSIPVRASDDLTVALARSADGSYEINGYDFTGISSAMYFTPFSLPLEGGTLTTLGIDPAAQPQPDWAPEGYGLWYVPVQTDDDGSSTPVPSRRQLVYPPGYHPPAGGDPEAGEARRHGVSHDAGGRPAGAAPAGGRHLPPAAGAAPRPGAGVGSRHGRVSYSDHPGRLRRGALG